MTKQTSPGWATIIGISGVFAVAAATLVYFSVSIPAPQNRDVPTDVKHRAEMELIKDRHRVEMTKLLVVVAEQDLLLRRMAAECSSR